MNELVAQKWLQRSIFVDKLEMGKGGGHAHMNRSPLVAACLCKHYSCLTTFKMLLMPLYLYLH